MKVTEACVSPAIAVAPVGAAGIAIPGGVTGVLATEGGLGPPGGAGVLLAITVKEYAVPFTKPLINTEVGGKSDPATGLTVIGATGGPAVMVLTV